jgi:uncharacterized protein (TIGR03435 family)
MKALLLSCTVGAVLVHAQAPRPLTFDVTSVKTNVSGEQGGSSRAQPGRYVGVNVTLRRVIGLAYSPVQEFVGGPDWINTARFDIEGKVDGAPSREQMQEMLRSLLADRFHLVVHRETREMPAYALELARKDGRLGSELRSAESCAEPGCGGFSVGNGSIRGHGVTMARLAAELPSATEGRYVVDRTGLAGTFDVALTWTAIVPAPDAASDGPPSIFAAIQEQLGLKLEPITAPIDVIVIDRAEKPQQD